MTERIRLGVSTCLLGENVRFDAGHKHDRFITDTLGQYVELVPVCPEVECGLGIPRESMRLVGNPQSSRLITVRTHVDHTDRMLAWAEKRVKALEKEGLGGIVDFHTRNKLLILAHSEKHHRAIGNLVAAGKTVPVQSLYNQYESFLMEALGLKATVKKNANVLYDLMGYFKNDLSPDEKQELMEIFDQYRGGYIPLIVPVTLINHYVRKYQQPYLAKQTYLNPHPADLQLRNHV